MRKVSTCQNSGVSLVISTVEIDPGKGNARKMRTRIYTAIYYRSQTSISLVPAIPGSTCIVLAIRGGVMNAKIVGEKCHTKVLYADLNFYLLYGTTSSTNLQISMPTFGRL